MSIDCCMLILCYYDISKLLLVTVRSCCHLTHDWRCSMQRRSIATVQCIDCRIQLTTMHRVTVPSVSLHDWNARRYHFLFVDIFNLLVVSMHGHYSAVDPGFQIRECKLSFPLLLLPTFFLFHPIFFALSLFSSLPSMPSHLSFPLPFFSSPL